MSAKYITEHLQDLADSLAWDTGGLGIQITYSSTRGMNYRYKVWHFHNHEGRGNLDHITWSIAHLLNEKLTKDGEIRSSGIGLDRRLYAVMRIVSELEAQHYFDKFSEEARRGLEHRVRRINL